MRSFSFNYSYLFSFVMCADNFSFQLCYTLPGKMDEALNNFNPQSIMLSVNAADNDLINFNFLITANVEMITHNNVT